MTMTLTDREERISQVIEGLPEGYELYAAVGALTTIAEILANGTICEHCSTGDHDACTHGACPCASRPQDWTPVVREKAVAALEKYLSDDLAKRAARDLVCAVTHV